MKKLLVILIALAVALPAFGMEPQVSSSDQIRALFAQAQQYAAQQEYRKARELLIKASDQTSDPYLKNLAEIQLSKVYLMMPDTAIWADTPLLSVARDSRFPSLQIEALSMLITIYAARKRMDKVQELLKRTLYQGELFAKNNQYQEALNYFNALLKQNYDLSIRYAALYDRGLIYLTQGNIFEAENAFNQVAKQTINLTVKAFALLELGKLNITRGEPENARWYLKKALEEPYALLFDEFKAQVLSELDKTRYQKSPSDSAETMDTSDD